MKQKCLRETTDLDREIDFIPTIGSYLRYHPNCILKSHMLRQFESSLILAILPSSFLMPYRKSIFSLINKNKCVKINFRQFFRWKICKEVSLL
jgi:hypothetical protein